MVDELERIRRLQDDAPAPSRSWVDDTRDELLALADEEAEATAPGTGPEDASAWQRALTELTRGRRRLAAAAAAVVLVAAVGAAALGVFTGDGQPGQFAEPEAEPAQTAPQATADTTPGDPAGPEAGVQLAASCTGPDGRYTVNYPEDWHTDPDGATPACEVFDPEPIAAREPGTGGAGIRGAVTIEVNPLPLDEVRDLQREGVLSSEDTTVDGRDAVRMVRRSTGAGALPEGLRSYTYLVDLGDATLTAVTYEDEDAAFEERRQLLDRMMQTLDVDG